MGESNSSRKTSSFVECSYSAVRGYGVISIKQESRHLTDVLQVEVDGRAL